MEIWLLDFDAPPSPISLYPALLHDWQLCWDEIPDFKAVGYLSLVWLSARTMSFALCAPTLTLIHMQSLVDMVLAI